MADEKKQEKKLAKVKRHQFVTNFYDNGRVLYQAGEHYPITPETASRLAAGDAKEVEVEVDPEEHEAQAKAATEAHKVKNARTFAAEAETQKASAKK
jgi:hypothetical protein